MADKATLRREVLADFATIPAADRAAWSETIARTVLALPEVRASNGALMAFLSMRDELDTTPLLCGALDAGLAVYSPCTSRRGRRLVPTRLEAVDAVCDGAYGIREPACAETAEPVDLGVVIVPAVAFDRRGYRLGRGGGYYDRFLAQLSASAVTCGVVFSRHVLAEVPVEPHDLAVDLVVTEREVIRAARARCT
jgi:5-formyltetrahydrofolate cyclo-ligase